MFSPASASPYACRRCDCAGEDVGIYARRACVVAPEKPFVLTRPNCRVKIPRLHSDGFFPRRRETRFSRRSFGYLSPLAECPLPSLPTSPSLEWISGAAWWQYSCSVRMSLRVLCARSCVSAKRRKMRDLRALAGRDWHKDTVQPTLALPPLALSGVGRICERGFGNAD